MKILYIGDIMGEPGIQTVEKVLPGIRERHDIDMVVAQVENLSDGKGVRVSDYGRLKQLGIDAMTGGNWTLYRDEIHPYLDDPDEAIVRPANYPKGTPGQRWKYVLTDAGKVLIVSLLGAIVGKDADKPTDNPLKVIDEILEHNKDIERVATIVNFHGDYSSEKRVIGYYLDGRVTAVIGDHWHVQSADAMVLPKRTAHITDVGMCGSLHSSLGVKTEIIINRWKNGILIKNELEASPPYQFNAVLIETGESGLAKSIERIQQFIK